MTTPIRIAVGLGTIGAVGGGSYLIHQQLSTDNIQKKLEANKYQALKKGATEWDEILKSYKDTVAITKNAKLKFDNFLGTEDKAKDKLQEHCEKILKDAPTDEDNYKRAEKWCTVPKTLTTILGEKGYRVLSTNDQDDSTDQKEWNNKLDKHIKAENEDKKFNDGEIAKATPAKKEETNRKAIKKKCKELNEKKHHDKDFDTDLEKAKLWCAVI